MSTFNKIYKKVANNGNDADYQVVGQVGVNGVPLDIMIGASSSSDGEIGLVPKPTKGNQNKYLRADGTWQTPPDTNTIYTHPTYRSYSSGFYKIASDGLGHVSGVTDVTKSDITSLGIASNDVVTTSSNGLMSVKDKSKLNKCGFYEAWANSDIKAWTSQTDQSLSNFWPFTNGFGNSMNDDPIIKYINGSTIQIMKSGFYTFNIRCLFNTYGSKRLFIGYKVDDGDLNQSIRISTKSNWDEIFSWVFTDFLSTGEKVQFWMGAFDTGSSLYLTPLETHIYFVPWVF